MNISSDDRLKMRNKIVTEGRAELDKNIKDGNYLEWLKKEHGVIDMDDILLDKDFLDDMKREIEKTRERRIVYDNDFKRYYLDEWIRKNNRKQILRGISEKSKAIKLKVDEGIENDVVN